MVVDDDLPWVEKYRPNCLKEIRDQDHISSLFTNSLKTNQILHILFYGPPGTGKTSTIRAFCKMLYAGRRWDDYVLEINASYDCGIDIVRNKIKPFCKKSITSFKIGSHEVCYKFIILDEADILTTDAQNSLRRCIESYSYNTRFCFLCNYVSRIITPITSRCFLCNFRPISKYDSCAQMSYICQKEGVLANEENLISIYNQHRGDLRKCLSTMHAIHSLYGSITAQNLEDYFHTFSIDFWDKIFVLDQTQVSDIVSFCDDIFLNGYNSKNVLESMIKWLILNNDDSICYNFSDIVSKFEKQVIDHRDSRLLVLDMVTTFWTLLNSKKA
jgi:replication factor C subunit 2/4